MRLLWVVPRFGSATVGGAERLVRGLASHALPDGWISEIATTCAVDHETWENVLDPGRAVEDGLVVHRFRVGPRDHARFWELHPRILSRTATYADELEWLANSVWAPDLQRFIEQEGEGYDLILFAPYLFGTTIWGAQVRPQRSALVPCLHDEPYAYLPTVRRVFGAVRGCLFNSAGEERLARRLHDVGAGAVVGMGFDAPEGPPGEAFAEPRGLGSFLLYAGRIEEGKRVDVAVDYAVRYAAERPNPPRLALIGLGSYEPPRSAEHAVVKVGFVGEEERRAAYAEALAFVNPSQLESLSLVLMEAWLEGTPCLVATGSEVMRDHCERSSGGFSFDSYEGFRNAVDRLRADADLRARMGAAGREYVLETYGWPQVRRRFRAAVEELAA
jgi:glycosyltransferase involved in cell wall biosynthesis